MEQFFVIITAGGQGTRMGSAVPKQFLELEGKPILRITIEKFMEAMPGIRIITVLPEDHIPYWREYCVKAGFTCPQRLVKGGFTRFHSVKNALEFVPEDAIVAVQDGVRPLISVDKIRALFALSRQVPAVIPVLPVTDTLKVLQKQADGTLRSTGEPIDRSRIYGAQTPQIFRARDIKAAYTQGYDTLFTDDASVAGRYGIPLTFTEGERYNIKITTPDDLKIAQLLISQSE